jgi:hypothetical protein
MEMDRVVRDLSCIAVTITHRRGRCPVTRHCSCDEFNYLMIPYGHFNWEFVVCHYNVFLMRAYEGLNFYTSNKHRNMVLSH